MLLVQKNWTYFERKREREKKKKQCHAIKMQKSYAHKQILYIKIWRSKLFKRINMYNYRKYNLYSYFNHYVNL